MPPATQTPVGGDGGPDDLEEKVCRNEQHLDHMAHVMTETKWATAMAQEDLEQAMETTERRINVSKILWHILIIWL